MMAFISYYWETQGIIEAEVTPTQYGGFHFDDPIGCRGYVPSNAVHRTRAKAIKAAEHWRRRLLKPRIEKRDKLQAYIDKLNAVVLE